MYTRLNALAAGIGVAAVLAAPAVASAAGSKLTVAAAPSQILSDTGSLVYGQLSGTGNAGKQVSLYQKVAGKSGYSKVQTAKTDANGYYEFAKATATIPTNRQWYVKAGKAKSKTISESVSAEVSVAAAAASTTVGAAPTIFTGSVLPNTHQDQTVELQELTGNATDGWTTIATSTTDSNSYFVISASWTRPSVYALRVVVPGNASNVGSASDTLFETVNPAANASLTLTSSAALNAEGQEPVTLTGSLLASGSAKAPVAGSTVTLWAETAGLSVSGTGLYQAIGTTTTNSTGAYTFTESPTENTQYYVTSTAVGAEAAQQSAVLFQAQQTQLTASTSGSVKVGGTGTIKGAVDPSLPGVTVVLQEEGDDGFWHDLETTTTTSASKYVFKFALGQAGLTDLRVHIGSTATNVGNNTGLILVPVQGVAKASSLPQP